MADAIQTTTSKMTHWVKDASALCLARAFGLPLFHLREIQASKHCETLRNLYR